MRTVLTRGAAVVAVLASLAFNGPASAATSDDCDPVRSTRIITGGFGDNTTDHLWIDQPTDTRVVVCFQHESLAIGGLTIIADYATGVVLPHPHVRYDNTLCPNRVYGVSDPMPFVVETGIENNAVCLTLGITTVGILFHEGNTSPGTLPVLEIWRDGSTDANRGLVDALACPVEWAESLFGGPTTCMDSNDRLFP